MASKTLVAPIATASFPTLVTPKAIGDSDPMFSLSLLYDPDDDLTPLREAEQAVIDSKWNGKLPKNYVSPFIDGDETDRPEQAGLTIIRLKAKASEDRKPPQVYTADGTLSLDKTIIYAGCKVKAIVNAYGWTYMGKSGVSFGLGDVQFIADGERLDGGLRGDQVFGNEAGADDDDGDDENPF